MRLILHVDANSFYASCLICRYPNLRARPVAAAGDPRERHGIILSATPEAKAAGVKVGMAIWMARQLCPQLNVLPPDYPLFHYFSDALRRLFRAYSDRVETYGLDEAWIDLSAPGRTFEDARRAAEELRLRVKSELGLTVSIGVAASKALAKLASDMRKPDAVTVLHPDLFSEMAGSLPVSALLFIGPATRRKLMRMNVRTLADLSRMDSDLLCSHFGKTGSTLQSFAGGMDDMPVRPTEHACLPKSIGHSATPPMDIATPGDALCLLSILTESVSARLMAAGCKARCVSLLVRGTDLVCASCQRSLPLATNLFSEIHGEASKLFTQRYSGRLPLRSMGISCTLLVPDNAPIQDDWLGIERGRAREETLARAAEGLRARFGHHCVRRGRSLANGVLSAVNPKEQHTAHPDAFFRGG